MSLTSLRPPSSAGGRYCPPVSPKPSAHAFIGKNENWFRLGSLVFDAILPAFAEVFHNDRNDISYSGLPRKPSDLFNELNTKHKAEIDRLFKKKVISKQQYDVLLPSNQLTDSKGFDVTLIVVLIRNLLSLPPPSSKNWRYDDLKAQDASIASYIIRGKEIRNYLCHHDPDSLDHATFQEKWQDGEAVVRGLKHNCNLQELRHVALDRLSAMNIMRLTENEKSLEKLTARVDVLEGKVDNADIEMKSLKIRVDQIELQGLVKQEKIKESPYMQWKSHDGLRFLFKFDESSEEIVQREVQKLNVNDWERENVDIREERFASSMRLVTLTCLAKNVKYRARIELKTDGGVRSIETDEFVIPQHVTHKIEHNGLQILAHDDGEFAKFIDYDLNKYRESTVKMQVFVGAGQVNEIMSHDDWLKFCHSNMYSFTEDKFTVVEMDKWDNLVMKNWKRSFSLVDQITVISSDASWKDHVLSVLKKKFPKGLFVFDNYDIVDHCKFFMLADIVKSLDLKVDDAKHTLVFIPKRNIMLMLRLIDTSPKENERFLLSVQSAIQSIRNDVKLFTVLHYRYLSKGNITIIPLLGLPSITKSEFEQLTEKHQSFPFCKDCLKYILFKDELSLVELTSFDVWWNGITENVQCDSSVTKECQTGNIDLLAQIIGYMATTDVPCLPGVYDSESESLQKISLTRIQSELLSISNRHLFIRGGYGTGKSIICQLKLYHLIEALSAPAKIYFLSHDSKSLLVHHMKEMGKMLHNNKKGVEIIVADFEELATRFELPQINLLRFLQIIGRECGNHVILDEFNAVELTKDVAGEIKRLLQQPNLNGSYIWIAVKPLSKCRRRTITEGTTNWVSDAYDLEATGVEIKSLGKAFRNTQHVYKLLYETKKLIEQFTCKFRYQANNFTQSHMVEDDEETSTGTKFISTDDSMVAEHKFVPIKNEHENTAKYEETSVGMTIELSQTNSSNTSIIQRNNSIGLTTGKLFKSEQGNLDDLDRIFKVSGSTAENCGDTVIETNFHIYGDSTEHCMKIAGRKPMLISPFRGENDGDINFETITRAYVALSSIIQLQKSMAIICTDVYEAFICVEALKLAERLQEINQFTCYMPTLLTEHSNGKSLQDALSRGVKNIIVTDTEGVTGLEFEKVVVTLSPSEYYLSHTLVRSLSRCQSELYFIEFPHYVGCTHHDPITSEIIKVWREKNLVNEVSVAVENCRCESDDLDTKPFNYSKEVVDKDHATWRFCLHKDLDDLRLEHDQKIITEMVAWETKNQTLYMMDKEMIQDILREHVGVHSQEDEYCSTGMNMDDVNDFSADDDFHIDVEDTLDEDESAQEKKMYLYNSAMRAPKPYKVACTKVFPSRPNKYGNEYHGALTREDASKLIMDECEGAYLVRERESTPGTYALTLRFDSSPKHYRLYYDEEADEHFTGEKQFSSIHELVEDALITMHIELKEIDYLNKMNIPRTKGFSLKCSNESTISSKDEYMEATTSSPRGMLKSFDPSDCEKAHNFKIHSFYMAFCQYCANYLWGLKQQGLRCLDCSYRCHTQCSGFVPRNCVPERKNIKHVFGTDLTTIVKAFDRPRPEIVDKCVEEIESRGLLQKDLYMETVSDRITDKLKRKIDEARMIPDMTHRSKIELHTICNLLMLYLRDLPEPIITFKLFEKFIQLSKLTDEKDAILYLRKTVRTLPGAHEETLRYICLHLRKILEYKEENLSSIEKLSEVFADILMRAPDHLYMDATKYLADQSKVVQLIIANYDSIFNITS